MSLASFRRGVVGVPAAAALVLALGVYLETRLWLVAKFPYFLDEGLLAAFAYDKNKLYSLDQGIRPGLTWLTVAGMWLHLAPLVAIRLAAVLFGLLGLVAGALVAKRFVGGTAAIAFVVLTLVTPFLVLYDALGLREPVVSGLVVTGFLLELELARRPRLVTGLLLGLTFAGDLWTHDLGKVALYFLPLTLVFFPFRSPARVRLALEWAGCVAVALGLALLATVPLRFESSYAHLAEIERKVGDTRPLSEITAHPLRAFDQSWPAVRDALTTYVTYPVLALAVAGLVLGLWRRPHFTALVAVWAVAQVASVIWLAATPYPRYLAPALPFVLLLASVGVQELARLAARVRPPVLLAAGVGVLVPALVFDVQVSSKPASAPFPAIDKEQYVTGYAAGTGLHEADDELKTLAHGRRLTVLSDPGKAPLALYVLTASDGPKVEWVWRESPDAKAATVLLDNGGASPPPELGSFHEVWRYQRPDGGVPIVLSVKHS